MTLYNTSNPGTRSYTSDELMRRRREAVRDRRLREGALISGRVLSPDTHSNIIELYPVQLPLAQ